MEHYAGIDVSLESSSVCIVDATGRVVREAKIASEPEALVGWFQQLGAELARIGLEAGPLSQWLYAAMRDAGFAVELLETRHVRDAFKAMPVKTDRKDPPEERTLPYFIRSCLHAIGLTLSGWAVHLTFAAVPRSSLAARLRRLPLAAELTVKTVVMTSVLTIAAVSLQLALYPSPLSRYWLAYHLPLILGIAFSASLLAGAIFEFRRLIGGRILGSFLLGTYRRPRREQRIVMSLDIADSTALAEQMGGLRVHDLITKFFFDIDQPIADHDGEVLAYV